MNNVNQTDIQQSFLEDLWCILRDLTKALQHVQKEGVILRHDCQCGWASQSTIFEKGRRNYFQGSDMFKSVK